MTETEGCSEKKKSASSRLTKLLAKLGLHRPQDLALHLPFRYEDETRLTAIGDASHGQWQQFQGEVQDCRVVLRPRRQLVAQLMDDSAVLTLRWLNFYPSLQKSIIPGQTLRVFGEVRKSFSGRELIHPRVQAVTAETPLPATLTPVYSTTAGLTQSALHKLIDRALTQVDLTDYIPQSWREQHGLPDFAAAVRLLHYPPAGVDCDEWQNRDTPYWQRIKLEELLAQQISLKKAWQARRLQHAPCLSGSGDLQRRLQAQLPFTLTAAQLRVGAEIAHDLAQPQPMHRLLQGDVGSGKTIVAAMAMLQAVESGYQTALMAPTELLAEQHFQKISAWLQPLGLEVGWLSGSRKKRERQAVLERLASGELRLVVGTHALLEEQVALPRLGLAIVDEQHRFGVRQRLVLRGKTEDRTVPHLLMMSATPIPRTLAMTHYADLDVSVIDELPPGRVPVVTKLVNDVRREEVIERILHICRNGRQAYWVCPLIEESEQLQLKTAQETYEYLLQRLPQLRIGLVHGRLKAEEKAQMMSLFVQGALDLLVSTTVIEVGVDVPNASVMVIEHAERFGLAQLHQLRGRVGRGSAESVCLLLFSGRLSAEGRKRLQVIYEHSDGFVIAAHDLRLRGPGEFTGDRQSGIPLLRYADLETDMTLIETASQLADNLLTQQPQAAEKLLWRWAGDRARLLSA